MNEAAIDKSDGIFKSLCIYIFFINSFPIKNID